MIKIRRLIPESSRKELNDDLTDRDLSAIICEDHSDALIGFVYNEDASEDEPNLTAVYDRGLTVNQVARLTQEHTHCSDEEALEAALDEFSWNASFGQPMIYTEIAGDYYDFNFTSYQANAKLTARTGEGSLANWGLGLAGEAGEVVELIKKHCFHGKALDRESLRKELGDVLWYISAICSEVGLELGDVAEANIDKLFARYPNGFVEGGGNRDE
jgi:NTP pyrophosphatase (non-canonical NTP hydrolase)